MLILITTDFFYCQLRKILQRTRRYEKNINLKPLMSMLRLNTPAVIDGVATNLFPVGKQHDAGEFLSKLCELVAVESEIFNTIFLLQTVQKLKCDNCQYESVKYESAKSLEVAMNENETKLENLLDSHFVDETVEYLCPNCNTNTHTKSTAIIQTAAVITVTLKRFVDLNSKNNTGIEVPDSIDFCAYMQEKVQTKFELVAYITHIGTTLRSGHYVCTVKSPDGRWIRFDDDKKPKYIDHEDRSQAYMLFYTSVSSQV